MPMVKHHEYKRKRNPLLPVIGLVLVVALGVIAYFSAPAATDLLIKYFPDVEERIAAEENGRQNLELAVAAMILIALLAVSMTVVSFNVRTQSALDDEAEILVPRNMDAKEYERYQKKLARNRAAKIKAVKKLKKKKEREQRRVGKL